MKLKGNEINISASLTKLRLVKLNEAREQETFDNVWSYDGNIMYKESNQRS